MTRRVQISLVSRGTVHILPSIKWLANVCRYAERESCTCEVFSAVGDLALLAVVNRGLIFRGCASAKVP